MASSTIANVLKENGIKPAPDRPSSWRTFLRSHWEQLAATDFFSAEVWTPLGLRTYYVLFVIDLSTLRAHIADITRNPGSDFMAQVARNLTDTVDGFMLPHRFVVCDRESKFTSQFGQILDEAGTAIIRTPRTAPICNAYAERFVRSIKSECLSRMMLFGESGLRRAVTAYIGHYNRDRPHQGIGNVAIAQAPRLATGRIRCSDRLGGILKHYHRAA